MPQRKKANGWPYLVVARAVSCGLFADPARTSPLPLIKRGCRCTHPAAPARPSRGSPGLCHARACLQYMNDHMDGSWGLEYTGSPHVPGMLPRWIRWPRQLLISMGWTGSMPIAPHSDTAVPAGWNLDFRVPCCCSGGVLLPEPWVSNRCSGEHSMLTNKWPALLQGLCAPKANLSEACFS